jgi:hypothetical protein
MSCAELAAGVPEPLAGTATRASRYLLVERYGAWGKDAVADSGLPVGVVARLDSWAGEEPHSRVLLVRRPERRRGPGVVVHSMRCAEGEAGVARLELDRIGDLVDAQLEPGEAAPFTPAMLLVCAHGRRDPCCARLGVPLYDALVGAFGPERVWQSSHQGGHRFAGNVLALPHAVQLGRVGPAEAASVATLLDGGVIPLDHYRGRTIHAPEVQAADAHVRERLGLGTVGDVRHVGRDADGAYVFATPAGDVRARVDAATGPALPPSCGAAPEPTTRFAVRLDP